MGAEGRGAPGQVSLSSVGDRLFLEMGAYERLFPYLIEIANIGATTYHKCIKKPAPQRDGLVLINIPLQSYPSIGFSVE